MEIPKKEARPLEIKAMLSGLEALGMTQVGLAHRIGVDPRTVRRWIHKGKPLTGIQAIAVRVVIGDST